jgi:hypothetical protein
MRQAQIAAAGLLVALAMAATAVQASTSDKVYYGGSVGLSFGDVFRLGVYPTVGYKLTPKASLGAEVGYEYLNFSDSDESSHNFGGSLFARYRVVPQAYAHAEFQLVNYETYSYLGQSSRDTVPFLLLGGGVVQPLGGRTSAYVEVLVDVLQDSASPYDDWEPIVSAGVCVGF